MVCFILFSDYKLSPYNALVKRVEYNFTLFSTDFTTCTTLQCLPMAYILDKIFSFVALIHTFNQKSGKHKVFPRWKRMRRTVIRLFLSAFKNKSWYSSSMMKNITNIRFVIIRTFLLLLLTIFWSFIKKVPQYSVEIFFFKIYTIWSSHPRFSVLDKFWKAIKCSRARDFFFILFYPCNFSKIDKSFSTHIFPFWKKVISKQLFDFVKKKLKIHFEMILIFQETKICQSICQRTNELIIYMHHIQTYLSHIKWNQSAIWQIE